MFQHYIYVILFLVSFPSLLLLSFNCPPLYSYFEYFSFIYPFILHSRPFCKLQLCLMSAVVCYGSLFSSINKDCENQFSSEWMTDWMSAYPEPFRTGSWSIFSELMIFRASWMGADSLMVIGFSRRRSDTCLCHHLHHQINHITMFNNFISDLDGNSINYN